MIFGNKPSQHPLLYSKFCALLSQLFPTVIIGAHLLTENDLCRLQADGPTISHQFQKPTEIARLGPHSYFKGLLI